MGSKKFLKHPIPNGDDGSGKYITSLDWGPDTYTKKIYLQAGLHADEAPGYLVVHHLIGMLDQADKNGKIKEKIRIVPAANPIGLSQWTHDRLDGRFDSFSGVNFNRDFPDLISATSELIKDKLTLNADQNVKIIRESMKTALDSFHPMDDSGFLKKMLFSLAYDSDIVLDLHCDCQALLHVYAGTPLWSEVEKLSERIGAQVCLLAEDSGVDPYDESCSKIWWVLKKMYPKYPIPLACLGATIELRGQADVSHDICKQDAKNIFNYLKDQHIIEGTAPAPQKLKRDPAPLSGVEYVFSDAFGVVAFLKGIGDIVEKGDVIAEIIKMNEPDNHHKVSQIKSTTDGILFTLISDRIAKPGKLLAKISGSKPLKVDGESLLSP